MKIDVEGLTFKMTVEQKNYVEQRMARALAPYADGIDGAEVWLSELRGSDDVSYKRCLVWVDLEDGGMVIGEHVDSDLRVAIYQAANQAGWKVRGWLERPDRLDDDSFDPGESVDAIRLAAFRSSEPMPTRVNAA